MDGIRPPGPFMDTAAAGSVPWSAWYADFELYATTIGWSQWDEARQRALLLHCLGQEGRRRYRVAEAAAVPAAEPQDAPLPVNQNDSALQFNVRLDGNWVTMLVDTGAAVSIIPRQLYETALSHRPLLPTTVNLRAYGGSQLVVTGVITASVETEDGRSCQGRLYVVDGGTPLLGRDLQKSLCISTWHGSTVYEMFLFSYRSTVQATTGRSPAELLHGRPMRGKLSAALDVGGRHPARPGDLHEHVKRKQTYQKTYFDRSHGVKTPSFSVGDQVRHRLPPQARKGQLRFSATKRIVQQRGPASYLLDDGTRVHADRLTRSAGSCPAEIDDRRGEPAQPDGAADRTGPTDAELESSGDHDRLEQQEQDRLEAIPEPETTDSHLRRDGQQLDVPPTPLEADETTSGRSSTQPDTGTATGTGGRRTRTDLQQGQTSTAEEESGVVRPRLPETGTGVTTRSGRAVRAPVYYGFNT
ncbi:hypothetical protein FJT64_027083 [Amphibalanus amphitrite]|uniref:Peptidase A2 domain-containing protein n=1 Tax=Amphibalanus amphitrite TaxID=1232801 RepID=A0A6A4VWQ5_AMPAM|nr:hypothetical protein FJT64_027083 [Amphibalanus amphitrite]